MPMSGSQYVAPTWVNDNEPAIDASELQAMSDTIEANQTALETTVNSTGDTMTGPLIAGGTQALNTPQVRNIIASNTDLTAGSSSLATGQLYLVYE